MRFGRFVFTVLAAVAAGCAASPTPIPDGPPHPAAALRASGAAKAKPTPSPSPTRTPPHLSARQIDAALESAETYYAALPHKDAAADLEAVAKHIVAGKAFAAATVSPGGISATLPDGSRALIVADRPEDRGLGVTAVPPSVPGAIGPPTQHEIAFLINEADTQGAFLPARQYDFSGAFRKLGFPAAGYGVDFADVSLENIVALGKGHPLDFFDLATHGMVGLPGPYYANLSTTPIDDAGLALYAGDIAKGTLKYAIELAVTNQKAKLPSFAFTPQFLTEHLTFNPGAIFDNQSCFGQSPLIANAVAATLRGAGVGRYIGWTKTVSEPDADQSDAFLLDRMLGEQSPSVTRLNSYAAQRTPAQRPFPLDAIESVMQTEIRKGPYDCRENVPYAIGLCLHDGYNLKWPPLHDGDITRLIFSDFGGENVPDPPLEYALPSIEYVAVTEYSNPYSAPPDPAPVLNVYGTFPSAKGSVTIDDGSASYRAPVKSWGPCTSCSSPGTTQIQVTIPNEGTGSSGRVIVRSAAQPGGSEGIASNAATLTQWPANLTEADDENITKFAQLPGKGAGHVFATTDFHFRADVQPAVVTIDTTPAPQNFTYSAIQNDSVGKIERVSGNFKSNNGQAVLAFSAGPTQTFTPLQDLYSLTPVAWTPKAGTKPLCNTSIAPGPGRGAGYALCTLFGLQVFDALRCADNANLFWCGGPTSIWYAFGYGAGTPETTPPGFVLTLNPQTDDISVHVPVFKPFTSGFGFFEGQGFDGQNQSTETDTFKMHVGPPLNPPPA